MRALAVEHAKQIMPTDGALRMGPEVVDVENTADAGHAHHLVGSVRLVVAFLAVGFARVAMG